MYWSNGSGTLRRGVWRGFGTAGLVVVALALPAASQAATGPTPFLDCVAANNGAFTAYFGYSDESPAAEIGAGLNNAVAPGITFQGQPMFFEPGTYRRVFSVAFGAIFTEVVWDLDGEEAVATETSPACDDALSAPASTLTPTTSTLNGVVTPNGEPTTYTFQWGTSTAYSQQSQPATVTGTAPQLVADQVTGLQPGTTYHFQLQASNLDDGVSSGSDETFTTPVAAIEPVDLSLTNAASSATIAAGQALTYTLMATNTNSTTAATGVTVTDPLPGAVSFTSATSSQGSCAGSRTVVCALGQLAPGASATVTIAGTAGGARPLVNTASVSGEQPDPNTANNVATATTTVVEPPAVSTGPGIGVPRIYGLVTGVVNPEGLATSYHFEYGTSSAYGHTTTTTSAGAGANDRFVEVVLTRLQPGRTYHYRLVASNAAGTTFGADRTLRTTSGPMREPQGSTIALVKASRLCSAGVNDIAIAVLGGRLRELSSYLNGVEITSTTQRVLGLSFRGGGKLTIVAVEGDGRDQKRSLMLKSCVRG
ncbi:MAG: hypothetical protein ACLP01_06475 [Solirubrobacteraceae bacterium]